MNFFKSVYYFFSPYTDSNERKVNLFFKKIRDDSSLIRTRAELLNLLQDSVAVVNLWCEYRYKGYKYLNKRERKHLYQNLKLIENDFESFRQNQKFAEGYVKLNDNDEGDDISSIDPTDLIKNIMAYFSLNRGVYRYQESSSFGRLLRDPSEGEYVGDCNQIVTLYIYIYSRYFDVRDLQLRIMPGHVALHFAGIDIEATSGTLKDYSNTEGAKLVPVEEIISINLLDVTDAYLETHEIAPEDFLQSSRLAYILSHDRKIVAHNLEVAYNALIKSLMERKNYNHALTLAKQSKNIELLAIVGNNGAVFYMNKQDYGSAKRYASFALKKKELMADICKAEGIDHFNNGRYQLAIDSFKAINNNDFIKKCYEAMFFAEQKKLPSSLTTDQVKQYVKVIKRMKDYAKKSDNSKLIQHVSSLDKLT